jgi:hypothetical protein
VLASEQLNPVAIAVDSTSIYWTNNGQNGQQGSVMEVPLCGGTPVTLFPEVSWVLGIALNSTNVFWALAYAPFSVLTAPLGGGAPITVAAEQPAAYLAADSTNVYWTDSSGTVKKAPVGGGAVTTLASSQDPYGIALDSDSVYWTNVGDFTGAIVKVPIGGGAITTIASESNVSFGGSVAVDSTSVYWTVSSTHSSTHADAGDLPSGSVMKAPKAGGTSTTLASDRPRPVAIAVDGISAYWIEGGPTCATPPCPGTVMKAPVGGGSAVTLASGQRQPSAIAVDSTSVYWVAERTLGDDDSSIMKLTPK